jgi:cytochrome P450
MSSEGAAVNDQPATAASDEHLCKDFDFFNEEHSAQVYEILGYAQQHCPVLPTAADGGYHVVTRYADVQAVLSDPRTYSSRKPTLRGTGGVRVPPIDTDPPSHRDFRLILNPFFHPKYLARYEDEIRRLAAARIDGFAAVGRCEFLRDFASPFVADVLATVIFNEDDEDLFRETGEVNHELSTNPNDAAFRRFADLIGAFIDRRVASGVQKDDIVTAIITGTVDDRPLTREERVGVVQLLFSGGLDTTKVAMSNILLHVIRNPGLEKVFRSPDWMSTHLDEFLRYESPVSALPRVVTTDTTLNGQQLNAGDTLLVHYAVANRDPARFDNPNELDFENNRTASAAFGLGIHRCLGIHLARLQLRLVFEQIFQRLTNFRLQDGVELHRLPGTTRILAELPVTFDQEKP